MLRSMTMLALYGAVILLDGMVPRPPGHEEMQLAFWSLAIPAAISLGTALLGGKKGSTAAKQAADIQSTAAKEIADSARATAGTAADSVTQATADAAGGVSAATAEANELLAQLHREGQTALDPYSEAGTTALTSLQELIQNPNFTYNGENPGYQFLVQEGQKALQRAAAARGTLRGGGTLKALMRYGQGLASQEYGAEFDRFMRSRDQQLTTLGHLVGVGQSATGQRLALGENYGGRASGNLINAATYGGNAGIHGAESAGGFRMTGEQIAANAHAGGADARAAGKIGAANAWSGALSGVGNAAQNVASSLQLRDLLKKFPVAPAGTPVPA